MGTCLECHAPANKVDTDLLVLLQTLAYTSGEIDNLLKEVRKCETPQDDIGPRKEIPRGLRAASPWTGEACRNPVQEADRRKARQLHR